MWLLVQEGKFCWLVNDSLGRASRAFTADALWRKDLLPADRRSAPSCPVLALAVGEETSKESFLHNSILSMCSLHAKRHSYFVISAYPSER